MPGTVIDIGELIPTLDTDKFIIDITSVSSKTSEIEYIQHHVTGEEVRAYHKTTGRLSLYGNGCDNGEEMVSFIEKVIHQYGGYMLIDQHSAPILGHRIGDVCVHITSKSIDRITASTLDVGLDLRVLEPDEYLRVVSDKLQAYYNANG